MPEAPPLPPHRLSIVVPLYNEQDNVAPLAARVHEALADYAHPWELILVDDGSSDDTLKHILKAEKHHGPHVRPVELTRNFKQTAAMQAGVDAARGDVIITRDGNDSSNIPHLVFRLLSEERDLVAGWHLNRQDAVVMRKIPSRIANRLISKMTGARRRLDRHISPGWPGSSSASGKSRGPAIAALWRRRHDRQRSFHHRCAQRNHGTHLLRVRQRPTLLGPPDAAIGR